MFVGHRVTLQQEFAGIPISGLSWKSSNAIFHFKQANAKELLSNQGRYKVYLHFCTVVEFLQNFLQFLLQLLQLLILFLLILLLQLLLIQLLLALEEKLVLQALENTSLTLM